MFADIEQHGEHALLRGGAGIQVIREHLVQLLAAAVNDDLLAVEMGVPERGRDVDDGARLVVVLYVKNADEALHVGEGEGEERGVHRADHKAVVAVVLAACAERQDDELLGGEPIHGLLTEL